MEINRLRTLVYETQHGDTFRTVYPQDFLTVIPFKDASGNIQFLTRTTTESLGCSITPAKGPENSDMQSLYSTISNGQDHLRRLEEADAIPSFYTKENLMPILISHVIANEADTVRMVYANSSDEFPILIFPNISHPEADKDTTAFFRQLDPGVLLHFSQDHWRDRNPIKVVTPASTDYVEGLQRVFPVTETIVAKQTEYLQGVQEARDKALDDYLAGEADQAILSIFKASEMKYLEYFDNRIEIEDPEVYPWVAREIANGVLSERSTFDLLLGGIISLCSNKAPIKLNNVPVAHTTKTTSRGSGLHYINGKKISAPDLEHCLRQVTCYPDDPAGYDRFLSTVSKVSLKYHQAQKDGLTFKMSGLSAEKVQAALAEAGYGNIGNSNMSGGGTATCTIPFRKKAGKKAEIYIAGAWRRILSFSRVYDILKSFGGRNYKFSGTKGTPWNIQTRYNYRPAPTGEEEKEKSTEAQRNMFSALTYLDHYLEPADRIILNMEGAITGYPTPSNSSWTRTSIEIDDMPADKVETLLAPSDLVLEEFSDSLVDALVRFHKSKEYLDETVIRTETQIVNYEGDNSYLVVGTSGTVYRITEHNAAVYNHRTNQHICIVNGNTNDYVGYDYIVSLILALRQDKRTSKSIYTLAGHVGQGGE